MLVWLAAPGNVAIDRAVNLAIIVLIVATVYRVTALARSGLLWRVSRKLILSYILVGAVPILLIVTFAAGFLSCLRIRRTSSTTRGAETDQASSSVEHAVRNRACAGTDMRRSFNPAVGDSKR